MAKHFIYEGDARDVLSSMSCKVASQSIDTVFTSPHLFFYEPVRGKPEMGIGSKSTMV